MDYQLQLPTSNYQTSSIVPTASNQQPTGAARGKNVGEGNQHHLETWIRGKTFTGRRWLVSIQTELQVGWTGQVSFRHRCPDSCRRCLRVSKAGTKMIKDKARKLPELVSMGSPCYLAFLIDTGVFWANGHGSFPLSPSKGNVSFCYVYFRTKSKTNTLYFHKSPCVWNQFPVISHKAVVLQRLLLHGFPSSQSFAQPSSDLEPPNEWQSKIEFQGSKCEIMFQCFSMLPPSSSAKTWSFDFNATECNSYERIRTDKDFSALQVVKWRKMHLLNITIYIYIIIIIMCVHYIYV